MPMPMHWYPSWGDVLMINSFYIQNIRNK